MRLLALILVAAATGAAADRDFNRLANVIESNLGVRRTSSSGRGELLREGGAARRRPGIRVGGF